MTLTRFLTRLIATRFVSTGLASTGVCLTIVVGVSTIAHSAELGSANSSSAEKAERRAKFHYQMFCQGCHTADGAGYKGVPTLKGQMYKFMQSREGREYLVRVPGSANSVLNDHDLTQVLNWMLLEFSESVHDAKWVPYAVSEITKYRQSPLLETRKTRARLLESFSNNSFNNYNFSNNE